LRAEVVRLISSQRHTFMAVVPKNIDIVLAIDTCMSYVKQTPLIRGSLLIRSRRGSGCGVFSFPGCCWLMVGIGQPLASCSPGTLSSPSPWPLLPGCARPFCLFQTINIVYLYIHIYIYTLFIDRACELVGCSLSFHCALSFIFDSVMLSVIRLCICRHCYAFGHSVVLLVALCHSIAFDCSLVSDCAGELVGCSLLFH
jgi:hypothetical protein